MDDAKRPNIFLIMSDEHDPTITGCYGHPYIRTPNIDQLSASGTVFENAYCNSPICLPSRMSFLTGQYVHQINAWDNGAVVSENIQTMGDYFAAENYETVLCGRMHINGKDRNRGFDHRLLDDMDKWLNHKAPKRTKEEQRQTNSHVSDCGPDGNPAWLDYDLAATELSEQFLREKSLSQNEKPWLLITGFMYPHFPLYCPEEYFKNYYPDRVLLPDIDGYPIQKQHPIVQQMRFAFRNDKQLPEELVRKALASYYGLVELTDHHIGRMLRIIEQSQLSKNTIVIYTSDHGEMRGMHGVWQKQLFYESAVKVPLVIKLPESQETRSKSPVSLVDLLPTLLSLIGGSIPAELSGRDISSEIISTESSDSEIVFSEYHAQGMMSAGYMVRKGKYKFNYYIDHSPQLFDLLKDPLEADNLAEKPWYDEVKAELQKELFKIVNPIQVDKNAKHNQKKRRNH